MQTLINVGGETVTSLFLDVSFGDRVMLHSLYNSPRYKNFESQNLTIETAYRTKRQNHPTETDLREYPSNKNRSENSIKIVLKIAFFFKKW